ncbi:MAG: SIMPL domain-containing protein [Bacillota bacterium]|nr:SIMPL domain-containing protein [Bacillota bacterium]
MGEEKMSRTLIIMAAILAVSLIFSAFTASYLFFRSRNPRTGTISVVGSAKQTIKSDFAVWRCTYTVQTPTLPKAYEILKSNQKTVKDYLVSKGIAESDMSVLAAQTQTMYVRNYNGMDTNQIEGYRLCQSIEIRGKDVEKINKISKEATELIDQGILMESQQPQFYYTKIADLKIEMLARATKDAKERAEKIAQNSGAKVTGVISSNMGVFQIRALYSDEISDYGINDTTSIDKEIMSVVNCEFRTK